MPLPIKRLCIIIAALKTLIAQISGTYDDWTSISMPLGVSGARGEPYQNIKSAVDYLQREARAIVYGDAGDQLGSSLNKNPVWRPHVMFG